MTEERKSERDPMAKRTADRAVVVVTGPPGGGKSRYIRRTLLPYLRKQGRTLALLEHRFSQEFGQHNKPPPKDLAFPEATAAVFDFGAGCLCAGAGRDPRFLDVARSDGARARSRGGRPRAHVTR